VADDPAAALHDPKKGQLKGIGLTMEAIEQNPVLYELMMDNTWRDQAIDLTQWLQQYLRNRYGTNDQHAVQAWDILRKTVYTVPPDKYIRDGAETIIQGRPTFDSMTRWANPKLNYNAKDLLPAWDELIKAAATCKNNDGFQFDLVDLTRQALANYAFPLQRKFVMAYRAKDAMAFAKYSQQFIQLIDDLDRLMATRKDFLLGPWIADARRWGKDAVEKTLYEKNAKDLLTLWGDTASPLHEYACRQWSGLLTDFYKPRWQQFFKKTSMALQQNKEMDVAGFQKEIAQWEWKWVNQRKDFPLRTIGSSIAIAKELYLKYRQLVEKSY
jgi:alpha-N-acetylglucosaminidase